MMHEIGTYIKDKVLKLIFNKCFLYSRYKDFNFNIANSIRPSVYESVMNSIDDQLKDDLHK